MEARSFLFPKAFFVTFHLDLTNSNSSFLLSPLTNQMPSYDVCDLNVCLIYKSSVSFTFSLIASSILCLLLIND